ncbi:MAG: hypothetical protein RLZZ155_641 [Bacteroidota bacterium]
MLDGVAHVVEPVVKLEQAALLMLPKEIALLQLSFEGAAQSGAQVQFKLKL